MADLKSAKMKKSKLVTICSTSKQNDDYPIFKYHGKSRSEQKEMSVTFPSYPTNLMYYEHYDSLTSASNRLSFIYVGDDANGNVCQEFYDYKQVQTVDFSDNISSVKAVFQIISQLRSCTEVRIFLSLANICLSGTDLLFPAEAQVVQQCMTALRNCNVKSLKVEGSVSVNSNNGQEQRSRTRLHDILAYAFVCFPKLEAVRINLDNSCGTYYDAVQEFCSSKVNLPKHRVNLKNRRVTCDPEGFLDFTTTPLLIHPVVVATSTSSSPMISAGKNSSHYPKSMCAVATTTFTETSKECSLPLLRTIKTEGSSKQVFIKQEKIDAPVIDLASDEDENHCSPPKKNRLQSDRPSSRASSTDSKASTVIISGSPHRLEKRGIGGGSSYDEWENDDDSIETPSPRPMVSSLIKNIHLPTTKSKTSLLPTTPNSSSLPTQKTSSLPSTKTPLLPTPKARSSPTTKTHSLLPSPKPVALSECPPLLPPPRPPSLSMIVGVSQSEAQENAGLAGQPVEQILNSVKTGQIQFDPLHIKNILQTVKTSSSSVSTNNQRSRVHALLEIKEGVHYERRPRNENPNRKSKSYSNQL
ncbi:unnamed protein product [Orchesella dallaii]|uniref:Uncharacterized protein n=1 Tax=Orchesella dallaii TaxID=48710 RepID=A0ABP1Q556_9HEXA